MHKQQEISAQKLKQRVGKNLQVLLEQKTDDGYTARSYADAPEIDGLVYIDTNKLLNLGEFYQVRVYDSDEYDLYGHLY
jgi:ribosomal protein S12 methylthiotransferase